MKRLTQCCTTKLEAETDEPSKMLPGSNTPSPAFQHKLPSLPVLAVFLFHGKISKGSSGTWSSTFSSPLFIMSTNETTSADTPMNNDELANALLQKVPATGSKKDNNGEQPVKIRKKPGRKPNPASPALRKAQNRAAQRAFRERKERHLRELEATVKQMREEREQLQAENEQLKHDSDVLKCENWYLKGIVLTLQLVCYRHNLVIPQHSPYMNEEALSLLAQSIPEPIAAYISANANNKLPIPSRWQNTPSVDTAMSFTAGSMASKKPRNRFLSQGSIVITKDGIQSLPKLQEAPSRPFIIDNHNNNNEALSDPEIALPALSPVMPQAPSSPPTTEQPQPVRMQPPNPSQHEDTITSNLAAIQILRLRLRLQSVCQQMEAQHFAIQPTVLQVKEERSIQMMKEMCVLTFYIPIFS